MIEQFLERLPKTATDAREIVTIALRMPDTLKDKIGPIRSDRNLSEEGKVRKIKELVLGNPASHLKQLRDRAAALNADLTNLRRTMQPPAPDRADLFGESQRRELRDYTRSLSPAARFRLAMEDEVVAEAVLGANMVLSGLSPEQFARVNEAYIERNFGAQRAGIAQREAVLEVVSSALEIAENAFCREAGLTEAELR